MICGKFLRPQEVKQAKADYSEGKITKEECDAIVDKAVTEVVAKQKELGFHIITDGEFRRTYWHLDFMWGFEGVGHEQDVDGTAQARQCDCQQRVLQVDGANDQELGDHHAFDRDDHGAHEHGEHQSAATPLQASQCVAGHRGENHVAEDGDQADHQRVEHVVEYRDLLEHGNVILQCSGSSASGREGTA